MKKLLALCLLVLAPILLTCCKPKAEAAFGENSFATVPSAPTMPRIDPAIASYIDHMPLSEQISQLFFIHLMSKDGQLLESPSDVLPAPGGYVLFAEDITTMEDTRALIALVKEGASIPPFVAIDEEGGRVSRLGRANLPGYTRQPSAASIGNRGIPENAYAVAAAIGEVLRELGIHLDFAPVADILTETGSAIGTRSFGSDPQLVSDMVSAFQTGLHEEGILSCPKHFPGLGNAKEDTHAGPAYGSMEALRDSYIPFQRAIDEGAEFIMAGHVTVPGAEESDMPASLSSYFLQDVLREEMGFTGVIVTDSMEMKAITGVYSPGEASILALQAGADMILLPADYLSAMRDVMGAVEQGVLSRERIRASLERVLHAKLNAGLLETP